MIRREKQGGPDLRPSIGKAVGVDDGPADCQRRSLPGVRQSAKSFESELTTPESFARDGFAIVPAVLSPEQCSAFSPRGHAADASRGNRGLLSTPWCAELAKNLREHVLIRPFLPAEHVAVGCTYFEKSSAANWLVPIHQDRGIPVAERVDSEGLSGWSEKEGGLFVHAPVEVLERMVAVRLHLDPCTVDDGPLRVTPGSHALGVLSTEAAIAARRELGEVVIEAPPGAAIVMRPLLLHASSKSSGEGRRRVLHFLYGPRSLPLGLRWRIAV